MKKLSLQQVLHLNGEAVYIEHKTLGNWYDQADGVYVLFDMYHLYLSRKDIWIDCNDYKRDWTLYLTEVKDDT